MTMKSNERTGIFVDGPNFVYACRSIGLNVDHGKLLDAFRSRSCLVGAHYFRSVPADGPPDSLHKFLHYLSLTGWRVSLRFCQETTSPTGETIFRDRADVDVAVSMVVQAPRLDHIFLFSGDGDFCPAVEAAQMLGARVTVVSTKGHSGGRRTVSEELIKSADCFLDLLEIADEVRRDMPVGEGQ